MSNKTVKNDNVPGLIDKGNNGRYSSVSQEPRLTKRNKSNEYIKTKSARPFKLARKVGQLERP